MLVHMSDMQHSYYLLSLSPLLLLFQLYGVLFGDVMLTNLNTSTLRYAVR